MPVETPTPRDISQLSWQPGAGTLQRLHTSGLRLTQARRAVLRALHDNRGRFLDAEAVHRWTKAATWRVNLTSVYRILAELDKARVAQATQIGARTFYSMVPEGEAAQPHFVCRRCGHAQALGSDVLLTQLFEGAARLGFHLDQRLTLFGVCSACNASAPGSVKQHQKRTP
ncbi:Fur family transcriptional regulator [Ottowia testudinis]|uniref:Fur family transcriptional regulator n=1 Tax=Ottowia testudinis TaxID=2816950 RepID=UPI0024DF29C8|nr:transcriptional repressor [Ottowia testudinis]